MVIYQIKSKGPTNTLPCQEKITDVIIKSCAILGKMYLIYIVLANNLDCEVCIL